MSDHEHTNTRPYDTLDAWHDRYDVAQLVRRRLIRNGHCILQGEQAGSGWPSETICATPSADAKERAVNNAWQEVTGDADSAAGWPRSWFFVDPDDNQWTERRQLSEGIEPTYIDLGMSGDDLNAEYLAKTINEQLDESAEEAALKAASFASIYRQVEQDILLEEFGKENCALIEEDGREFWVPLLDEPPKPDPRLETQEGRLAMATEILVTTGASEAEARRLAEELLGRAH